MALIYDADLSPTKPEIISKVLSQSPWFTGDPSRLTIRGAYRFDDPQGVTGFETHIVQDHSGVLYQVPLSYRPEPFAAAEAGFITEMAHSVLNQRWIYDARKDPTFHERLAAVLNGQQSQAEEFLYQGPDDLLPLDPTFLVTFEQEDEVPQISASEAMQRFKEVLTEVSSSTKGLIGRFSSGQTAYQLA